MTFDTTDSADGVSMASGSRITFAHPGIYNIAFSAQAYRSAGGSSAALDIWLSHNNIDVADSNTELTFANNGVKVVAAWNWFVTVTESGQYYEIKWWANDDNIVLYGASATHGPLIPSVILTVNQVH